MIYGLQLLTANKFSLIHWGSGVWEQWCVAHPCPVWENLPYWWYEFKGPPCHHDMVWITGPRSNWLYHMPLSDLIYSLWYGQFWPFTFKPTVIIAWYNLGILHFPLHILLTGSKSSTLSVILLLPHLDTIEDRSYYLSDMVFLLVCLWLFVVVTNFQVSAL